MLAATTALIVGVFDGLWSAHRTGRRLPCVGCDGATVGAPLVLGFAYLLRRSERIKEVALRDAVLVMGAAGALIMLLVVSAMASFLRDGAFR